jgi:hypothetical protein
VKYSLDLPHIQRNINERPLTKSFSTAHIHVMDINLNTLNDDKDFESLEAKLQNFDKKKKWIVVTLQVSLCSSRKRIYFIY